MIIPEASNRVIMGMVEASLRIRGHKRRLQDRVEIEVRMLQTQKKSSILLNGSSSHSNAY